MIKLWQGMLFWWNAGGAAFVLFRIARRQQVSYLSTPEKECTPFFPPLDPADVPGTRL